MFDPSPKFQPEVQPRAQPKVTIPSLIGESGQVGNWLFYNGVGDVLYDHSGHGNHGDFSTDGTSYPDWADGRYGWAVDFPGVEEFIAVPHDSSLAITSQDMTILTWFRREASKYHWLCTKYEGGTAAPWGLYVRDNDDLGFIRGDGTSNESVLSDGTVPLDSWVFLGAAQSGWDVDLYINGLDSTKTMTSVALGDTGKPVLLGTRDDKYSYSNGKQTLTYVYNEYKTQSEVERFFQRTRPIFGV